MSSSGRLPAFPYIKDRLHAERAPLSALADRFGTPLYVYSAASIAARFRSFDRAFATVPHTVCYSVKANSNLSVLKLLAKLGAGFDVVSGGELERVLRVAGKAAGKIVFSGVGKTADELRAAVKADILLFNVESAGELELLAECASRLKKKARVALRVNPDVPAETHPYISTGLRQHKFGVPIGEAGPLYRAAARHRHLEAVAVSVHIGSQITEVAPFAAAMERVSSLVTTLRADGHDIRLVDAGGGLGIDYKQGESEASFSARAKAYATAVLRSIKPLKVRLLLEPGRAIIGPAGLLLSRVLYVKHNGGKRFVVVDAAMNDLIRPSLYNAYHEIVPVVRNGSGSMTVDVVGPICESGDFFARDRVLPECASGDLLAILDTGAYGMSLGSNYNTRPRAAEVLVDGKSARLIRKRETVRDLYRFEL